MSFGDDNQTGRGTAGGNTTRQPAYQSPLSTMSGVSTPRALPPGAAYAPQTFHYSEAVSTSAREPGVGFLNAPAPPNRDMDSTGGPTETSATNRHVSLMQPSLSDTSSGPSTIRASLPTPPSSKDSGVVTASRQTETTQTARHRRMSGDAGSFITPNPQPTWNASESRSLHLPPIQTDSSQAPALIRRHTDVSQDGDYALPLQFSPIPAHLGVIGNDTTAATPSPDRPRPSSRSASYPAILQPGSAQSRSQLDRSSASSLPRPPSTIPSFTPAAAFSAGDRGPYPPVSPSSSKPDSISYVGAGGPSDTSNTLLNSNLGKGKGRLPAGDDVNNESEMLAFANAGPGKRESSPRTDLSTSMVGVGRSSIVRATAVSPVNGSSGLLSQQPQQAIINSSMVDSSPASSPVQQQQFGFANQPPPQPSFVSPRLGLNRLPSSGNGIQAPPQPQVPPHLIPQPEICVECMMRDRDMADVDVVGEGVWDRDSDVEFEEALRWEDEHCGGGSSSADHGRATTTGSEESGSYGGGHGLPPTSRSRRRSREGMSGGGSRESVGGRSSLYGGPGTRKRIGRGQLLTSANLKLWLSMNPPASSHRWRTLQTYLATQNHLLELEKHARDATAAEKERIASARAADNSAATRKSTPPLSTVRSRSSAPLPHNLVLNNAADHMDLDDTKPHPRNLIKTRSRQPADDLPQRASLLSLQPYATTNGPQIPINVPPSNEMQSYSYGDQPWLSGATRRYSSSLGGPGSAASSVRGFSLGKFARSSTDLRSTASPRSVSPARTSLGVDERRGSMWSKFRQSASQSVLSFAPSFAPSGSMVDMHLGLSMDQHRSGFALYDTYPSMSDPAVARHVEHERDKALATGERPALVPKSKKGIKGFFSKLVGGGGSSDKKDKKVASVPVREPSASPHDYFDNQDLAPPPPLSALANEPRYHGRSPSSSSVDSFGGPYTPPPPLHFRHSNNGSLGPNDYIIRAPTDRGSIMTTGSYASTRSNNAKSSGAVARTSLPLSLQTPVGAAERRPSNDSFVPSLSAARASSPEPYLMDEHGGTTEVLDSPTSAVTPIGASPHRPRTQKSLPLLPSELNNVASMGSYGDMTGSYAFLDEPPPPMPCIYPYRQSQAARSSQSVKTTATHHGYGAGDDRSDAASTGRRLRKGFLGSLGRKDKKATPVVYY
ncbi:hypothetical protein OIO90_003393 [Microbotryomycetes sp. JL221]|nr:hypothetical protein OIO90_003393 [Microbotryomycetes sp. JL221]